MTVIQIENLWKEYRLGVIGHGTITHDLQSWWARVRGKEDPNVKIAPMVAGQGEQVEGERFWALMDVNLEVKQGDVLGIIGKNGAGKSTLLKILSRVTAPTRGNIRVRGRIASLLEVGTGFHPELTGRENIFMNGAILGMTKQEIKNKLDEIVSFSGVEQHIDTPVKRYSSGMYVRLAFAVAAHLEPEILVIDEVLAVGDAEFQKKCLGKMGAVAREGRTVLFVSHNMGAVKKICTEGILIKKGSIVKKDAVDKVVKEYIQTTGSKVNRFLDEENYKIFRNDLLITGLSFEGDQLVIDLYSENKFQGIAVAITIRSIDDTVIFKTSTAPIWSNRTFSLIGKKQVNLKFESLPLVSGTYKIGVDIVIPNVEFLVSIDDALFFNVEDDGFYEGMKKLVYGRDGYVLLQHDWEF